MNRPDLKLLLLMIFAIGCTGTVLGQDNSAGASDSDESSEQTEESEEAYRRRMELEGARDQDTYSNVSYTSQAEEEAIDKLPQESQKNIRDQITDIIIENGQWKPGDVLEDYPYEPTEAAEKDPVLKEQEEEAWAEQVDKYHEREAAAFGAARPPAPGSAQQQAEAGSSGSGEQSGGEPGAAGQNGGSSGDGGSDSAGAYQPYQPGSRQSGDETSTAGVSESALDFLRGKQGQQPSGQGGDGTQGQPPAYAGGGQQPQDQASQPGGTEQEQQTQPPDGSLPIEQLDRIQGIAGQSASGQPDSSAVAENQSQQADRSEDANQDPAQASEEDQQEQFAEASPEAQAENESQEQESAPDLDLSTAGIIAIRDLKNLEGVEAEDEDGDGTP